MNKSLAVILSVSPMPLMASEDIDVKLKAMLVCQDWAADHYVSHLVNNAVIKGGGIDATIKTTDEIITVDSNTLRNSLPYDVELPVKGFSYSHSEEKSTTNSSGWTFSYNLNANASFNVLFASGGITHSLGLQYDMSTDKTKTISVNKTWDLPSFFVNVPANRTYRVDYYFKKVSVSGYSKLDAELYGIETRWGQRPQPTQTYKQSFYRALERKTQDCQKGFVKIDDEKHGLGIYYTGRAPFSAAQGMDFFVDFAMLLTWLEMQVVC
ncbi:ETX/MTX2 family pore-forming toxin [Chromobacterium haemolyticum]|nr:ETX/MTX2 family pore-forming toxin [Chromobacterium haemolyticum]